MVELNINGIITSKLYDFVDLNLIPFIYIFHMPLFIFVSGALFYKECIREDIKFDDIIRKKFKRLIIPYIVYGVTYNIIIKTLAKFYVLKNVPYAVIAETLLGMNITQHIWFLPTLFITTIIFYIVFNGLLNKDIKKLSIVIFVIALFSLHINITFPGVKYLPLLFIAFSFGAIFEKYRENIESKFKDKYLYIIIALIFFIIGVNLVIIGDKIRITFLSDLIQTLEVLNLILSIFFISFFISKFEIITENKIFKLVNKYSFEIYILGDPLNYLIIFLISKFNLAYIYKTLGGTLIILLTRTVGIGCITIIFAKIIEKLKRLKYFKIIIKTFVLAIIVSSILYITYNSIKHVRVKPIIYEVIEENYE